MSHKKWKLNISVITITVNISKFTDDNLLLRETVTIQYKSKTYSSYKPILGDIPMMQKYQKIEK